MAGRGPPRPVLEQSDFWTSPQLGEEETGSSSLGLSPALLLTPLPTWVPPSQVQRCRAPWALGVYLDGRTFLQRGRTQLSLGQQLPILLGGQPGGRGLPWSPGTGLAPCSCQCYAQALGQARRDGQTGGMGVKEGDETGAGQPWGRGRTPGFCSLILPLFLSTSLCSPPASCLVPAFLSFWGQPSCRPQFSARRPPARCLPAACPLPVPGHPLPPHGPPGRPQRRY